MGSKQKPVYAFERNVDDKEEMQVSKKTNAEEALKYISNSDYIGLVLIFIICLDY
jgi:ATP/ADP translocase